MSSLSIVIVCLAVVIGIYFYNNPLKHGPWFLSRRFINWFPLGMTYAFLYMGRYNLTVAKNALGSLMNNEDFGLIFAAGTGVYAFSFLVNGPLVDKIGGKKGIIIAALGAALANIALGVITWLVLTGRTSIPLFWPFVVIYALNMYFQSYGAVSIIKVKANWFHVRERGVFGAIFGTLISFGVYFAFDWGPAVVEMTKVHLAEAPNWLTAAVHGFFVAPGQTTDATWAVFFMPAGILLAWALLDWWLIKETPEDAGFPHLDTHDASSGHMHEVYTTLDLLKKVFLSPLMLMLGGVELTAGVLRNGIMQWYTVFAKQVPQPGAEGIIANWGLLLCLFGIVGGFAGGLISDKFFQSRRGPPAAIFCAFMLMMAAVMAMTLRSFPFVVGLSALLIVAAVTGVHKHEPDHQDLDVRTEAVTVLRTVLTNPKIWIIGLAYACTGAVRQSVDQWFPRYMLEVHDVSMGSAQLKWLGFLIPFVASLGSVISGYISDRVFDGRRAPVAMGLYFLETGVILLAAQMHSVNLVILFFVLISFTANATHSIMGPAAAMDIGGRKMAGFAHGLIDSFQYLGGALAGALLGALIDRNWGYYFYFMVPFGLIGGTLMWTIRHHASLKKGH